MELRHLPICHTDPRGTIRDLYSSGTPDCLTVIESAAGAVRGDHVHDQSTQHAVVLSGRMWAYHRAADPGSRARRTLLHPGDLVTHPPGEEHAYQAQVATTLLVLTEGVRRGTDYEQDTRRVPSLVQAWTADHEDLVCSVLIPSRRRPSRLLSAIASVHGTTSSPGAAEVLVRVDDDDQETLAAVPEIERAGARVVVGPRGQGYGQLASYYDELSRLAQAPWCWVMNDDARVASIELGDGAWNRQLAQLPTDGVIVQPEVYQLGASRYPRCVGGAFPIVPTRCWQRLGYACPDNPIDVWLSRVLLDAGWRTSFLSGVDTIHDRDSDDVIGVHRAT